MSEKTVQLNEKIINDPIKELLRSRVTFLAMTEKNIQFTEL